MCIRDRSFVLCACLWKYRCTVYSFSVCICSCLFVRQPASIQLHSRRVYDASRLVLACLTAPYGTLESECPTFKNCTTNTLSVYWKYPYSKDSAFDSASVECLPLMEVGTVHVIRLFKRFFPIRTWLLFFLFEMNAQSVRESLFSTEQVQK